MTAPAKVYRSALLTGLSYPMLLVGLVLLFLGHPAAGVTLTACATFLIGITELCLHIELASRRPTE